MADDSGLGGTTMQYQVQLDPNKLFSYGVTVPQIVEQLAANNANAGGGFYSQGGQFYYVRGLGQVRKSLEDIGNIVVSTHGGIPVYVKDVAKVAIDHAPRLGQFGYMQQDDAVEGVILMRVGEQAQVVLKKVEELTDDAEQDRAAARREDRAVLRPHGPDRGDDQDRREEPGSRHAAGAGRSSASSCSASARR